jgi:hypothetical protein
MARAARVRETERHRRKWYKKGCGEREHWTKRWALS